MTVLEELERAFPDEPEVLSSIASVYALYALDDEAAPRWQRSIALAPNSASPYNAMGVSALVRGDYGEAIQMLDRALGLDPALPRARLLLGEALSSAGQMRRAVEELERYVDSHPQSAEALFRLGQAQFHLGQYEKAKQCHLRAIQADPNFHAPYLALATACESLGQSQEAERYRHEFARRNAGNDSAKTVDRGGVNDVDLGSSNLAETHLVAAKAYLGPARTRLSLDRAAEAERHLRAAAKADRKNRESRQVLVSLYDRQKRNREAADVVAELEELEPKEPTHRIRRGILLVRIQQTEAAEKEFRQAIALAPEDPEGYAKLAMLLLKSRTSLREARELAESAVRLKPKEAVYHALVADICGQQGDRPAAQAALRRAIELDPGNPRVLEAKVRLDGKKPHE